MNGFLQKHAGAVTGILSGFDRLVFRGTLRNLAFAQGVDQYLGFRRILLKDAGAHFNSVSTQIERASLATAEAAGRPIVYLPSAQESKEEHALAIAKRDGISKGLIGVLKSVEPCQSFSVRGNRATKHIELRAETRKCLHFYHYFLHEQWGLMHARLQTWFPFQIQICLNGREALARAMDRAGLKYRKADNCFLELGDARAAQALADEQLKTDWPALLDGIARTISPALPELLKPWETRYYWSTYQSEWASDVMFKDAASLAALYPGLLHHGMTTFKSPDVMRFLGHPIKEGAGVHPNYKGQVVSSLKRRAEGVRIKHRAGQNAVKMYDKQGSVLRVETTLQDPRAFKVYRPVEGRPEEQKTWLKMRQGIADLHRRAEVSQASNERYLEALAAVDSDENLGALMAKASEPVRKKECRARGLDVFGKDAALLAEVGRGEYAINGMRNRDLRAALYGQTQDAAERKKQASRMTRHLRLLRAHGLIRKVPKTHRYQLTERGRELVVALGAAATASIRKLTAAA